MRTLKSIPELRRFVRKTRREGKTIGFIPTMGALHEGHRSLIRRARAETDRVVVSIFVNAIQFDRKADFRSYPRTLYQDARIAAAAGADVLFIPTARAMYPLDFETFVEVTRLGRQWEGRHRPGHFRGVTTVVAKLFHLVEPDTAYFGQKDAQQARIIRQMTRDLNFDVRIKILPTVREPDGLAMSSRNRLLPSELRRPSRALFEALQEGTRLIQWGERRADLVVRRMRQILRRIPRSKIDYVAIVDPETLEQVKRIRGKIQILLAVWVGRVRLIDNKVI